MPQTQSHKWIPTFLTLEQFETFVLPHLHIGSRGPQPKLSLHVIFNYILKFLHTGCQWKELPIEKDKNGHPEIHHSSIYRAFRRFETHGCFEDIFKASVSLLHEKGKLDTTVIHGDGTTTAAKKGGDNLGFSGHKHMKGDKVVAFCNRNCNIISPFVTAPGNRNESPLFKTALSQVMSTARTVGIDLTQTIVSWMVHTIVVIIARPFSIGVWYQTSMKILVDERRPSEVPKDCSIHMKILKSRKSYT